MTTKKFTPIIKRGPRLTPGEINVTPPDDLGVEIPPSGIQKALPWVMGGGMLGMIAIMIFTGIRQLSPYMLMMPLMMVMATVGFMAGGGPGGKRVPEINADRKEYLRYLAGLRTRVTSSAAAQVTFFNYHAPHPDDSVVDRRDEPAVVASSQRRLLRGHSHRHRRRARRRPAVEARGRR